MSHGTIAFGDCRYKVTDLAAAKKFYSKAFGVQPYFDEPDWAIFLICEHQLWLEPDILGGASVYESTHPPFQRTTHESRTNFWRVDDVEVVYHRFIELGGTIMEALRQEGPFTSGIVLDPWGNKVGLLSGLF